MSSTLDAARDYARRGWRVVPLHSVGEHGRCTCGDRDCSRIGKHPLGELVPNGLNDATSDEQVIAAWWERAPWANVGVRTGWNGWSAPALLVVDQDLDGDGAPTGPDTWHELEHAHGAAPPTVEQITGSGGRQLVFRRPSLLVAQALGNSTGSLPDHEHLHIRCDGGYIVAPPSRHASGRSYEWDRHPDEVELAPAPAWLLAALLNGDGRTSEPLAPLNGAGVAEGQRNATLAAHGGAMRRYGHSEAAIRAALSVTNREQCRPPLGEREVERIAHSVARYAPEAPILTQPAAMTAVVDGAVVIRATAVQSRSIRWAWTGRLPFGYLVVQTGLEGLGKSVFAAWMIARLTRGELDGELAGTPVDVLIVAGEDGIADTWKPRLALAGADMDRVAFLNLDGLGPDWNVRDGVEAIEQASTELAVSVLFVDALLDHMPPPKGGESINSPTFVRAALTPLKRLVRRLDQAALYSMHPPKGRATLFRDMVQASQAFAAIPRVGLFFAYHPDDASLPEQDRRRVLLRGKGNLGRNPGALEFRVVGELYRHEADDSIGEREVVSQVQASDVTLADLMPESVAGHVPSKRGRAAELIRKRLHGGGWHESQPIIDMLAGIDVSYSTAMRAADDLGIQKRKRPGQVDGPWEWRLEVLTEVPAEAPSGNLKSAPTARATLVPPLESSPKNPLNPSGGERRQLLTVFRCQLPVRRSHQPGGPTRARTRAAPRTISPTRSRASSTPSRSTPPATRSTTSTATSRGGTDEDVSTLRRSRPEAPRAVLLGRMPARDEASARAEPEPVALPRREHLERHRSRVGRLPQPDPPQDQPPGRRGRARSGTGADPDRQRLRRLRQPPGLRARRRVAAQGEGRGSRVRGQRLRRARTRGITMSARDRHDEVVDAVRNLDIPEHIVKIAAQALADELMDQFPNLVVVPREPGKPAPPGAIYLSPHGRQPRRDLGGLGA